MIDTRCLAMPTVPAVPTFVMHMDGVTGWSTTRTVRGTLAMAGDAARMVLATTPALHAVRLKRSGERGCYRYTREFGCERIGPNGSL